MKKVLFILAVLFILTTNVSISYADQPLPYRIQNPHIIRKTKKVLIEWRQIYPYTVQVFKLSNDLLRPKWSNCPWNIETFGYRYCRVIWARTKLTGNMRVQDDNYRKGDEYYILQYAYQTHNGAYGPFLPE